jgi:hypothetical protein
MLREKVTEFYVELDDFYKVFSTEIKIQRKSKTMPPLMLYLKHIGLGKSWGINYIDSTLLRVCHIKKGKATPCF